MAGDILTMPRLGETMEEGRVVGWLIGEGDAFRRGDSILEVETDKTVAELPALADGVLAEKLVEAGDMVAVGAPIARLKGEASAREPASASRADEAAGRVVKTLAMPRLGETMDEGRIVGWLVKPGSAFKRGDALVEIETDKTVAEYPALLDGTLVETLAEPGAMLPVGAPLARLEIALADAAMEGFVPEAREPEQPVPPPAEVAASLPATTPEVVASRASSGREGPIRATPVARRLAARGGIDLAGLTGTGRRGRIEARDVAAGTGARASGIVAFDRHGSPDAPRRALLLHGFSGDRTTFAAFGSMLARAGYDVLVPDLPSHGATRVEAASAADLAAPLPGFLAAEGFRPTEIVAHSLGAVAAVSLAETLEGVERLTLICPTGLGLEIDGEFVAGMASRPSPGALRHLLRRLTAKPAGLSDPAVAALSQTLAEGRLAGLADAVFGPHGQSVDIVEPLSRLARRMSVRIVVGLEDRIIPWTQVTAAPSRVAVHLVPNAGHMPHWDQPAEVLALFEGGNA